jgi:hypothetical protein
MHGGEGPPHTHAATAAVHAGARDGHGLVSSGAVSPHHSTAPAPAPAYKVVGSYSRAHTVPTHVQRQHGQHGHHLRRCSAALQVAAALLQAPPLLVGTVLLVVAAVPAPALLYCSTGTHRAWAPLGGCLYGPGTLSRHSLGMDSACMVQAAHLTETRCQVRRIPVSD